jgi:hypothetical protein
MVQCLKVQFIVIQLVKKTSASTKNVVQLILLPVTTSIPEAVHNPVIQIKYIFKTLASNKGVTDSVYSLKKTNN